MAWPGVSVFIILHRCGSRNIFEPPSYYNPIIHLPVSCHSKFVFLEVKSFIETDFMETAKSRTLVKYMIFGGGNSHAMMELTVKLMVPKEMF